MKCVSVALLVAASSVANAAPKAISCEVDYDTKSRSTFNSETKEESKKATRVYVLDDAAQTLDWLNPITGGLEPVCSEPRCDKLSYGPKMIKYGKSETEPGSPKMKLDMFQIDRVKANIEYAHRTVDFHSGYYFAITFKGTCAPAPLPSERAPAAKF